MGVGGSHCQIFSQAGEPISSGRQLPTCTNQETRKGWAWLLREGFPEESALSQAWGEVCWAVWLGPGGQRGGLGAASRAVGEDSLLGWSYQPRVGAPAFSGSAWPWVTRQETNTLSSAPIGNSAPVTSPCSLVHGIRDTGIEKKPPDSLKQLDPGTSVLHPTSPGHTGHLTVPGGAPSENCSFSSRSHDMTSRQSGWHRPGGDQGSIPGWGTKQLCGHGQVLSPQRVGVSHSGAGRAQHWPLV